MVDGSITCEMQERHDIPDHVVYSLVFDTERFELVERHGTPA